MKTHVWIVTVISLLAGPALAQSNEDRVRVSFGAGVTVRHDLRPGDMGRVIAMHGVLYAEEYGWITEYEALAAEIVAQFLRNFDPARERCWVAEREGTPLGVMIQWARGIGPAVPTDIGGAAPAVNWPELLRFLIYPAGQLQIGRGEEVNLGVVHDSTKFSTNDFTALFAEECVGLVDRSVDTRIVTVPVCPSGESGAQSLISCDAS